MSTNISLMRILMTLLIITSLLPADESALNHTTRNYDQKHIKLDIEIDIEKETVRGTASLQIYSLVDNLRNIMLHSESSEIHSVTANGNTCKFKLKDGLLKIDLRQTFQKDARINLDIRYTARPQTGLYFFYPREHAPDMPRQVWSQGQADENRHWFPCYDLPDDKLTSEIRVSLPAGMKAFSNGDLLSENIAGDRQISHWKTDFEHSPYLISLVAGFYFTESETVQGIPLNYNSPIDMQGFNHDLAYGRTADMLIFYNKYIGPYPYSRYDQNTVHDFRYGGMENTTASTLNRVVFHGESALPNYSPDGLIAHELVHQWFGDLVTCKTWEHIWLNEGITSYFTDLFFEDYAGENEFRKRRYRQNRRYESMLKRRPLADIKPSADGVTPVELSGGKAYNRGAAVTHMLRYELGDAAFQQAIRRYVRDFRYSTATSEDFRKILESVSGKDLSTFFKQWVYGAGLPHFQVVWQWDDAQKQLELFVEQQQDSLPAVGIFRVNLPLEITAGTQVVEKQLHLNAREQKFTFKLDVKPDMIRFDKNEWILKKLTFKKTFEELQYQLFYDTDVTGRYVAAAQLPEYGEKALPLLRRALQRENFYWVREKIAAALGEIEAPAAMEVLALAAKDSDGRVRTAAAKALGNFSDDEAAAVLRELLANDPNDHVVSAAALSLAKTGTANAFETLEALLSRESYANLVRRGALAGMAELKDARALPHLKEYVKYRFIPSGSHRLETTALTSAEKFIEDHRKAVLEIFETALHNPYSRTRGLAARLLAKHEGHEKKNVLKDVLKNERRSFARRSLENAMQEME